MWGEAASALSRELAESKFRTYVSDTHALAFDRSRGALIIQTPNPLTNETLAHRFHTTIMRTIHDLRLASDGIPIHHAQFQSRR